MMTHFRIRNLLSIKLLKRWSTSITVFLALVYLLGTFLASPESPGRYGQAQLLHGHQSKKSDLDSWISQQAQRSWTIALGNISPPDAVPGTIVASLSTSKPDYYYSWTRDTAIVLKEIVLRFEQTQDPKLLKLIKDTISAAQTFQKSAADLGEPKYFVNGTAFTGPWGRPQRDGPALRAAVYIRFALSYLKVGGKEAQDYVKTVLYDGHWRSQSVIKADLEYIANNWRARSFDLWEEVNGVHFFTFSVIYRALKDGARFARKMDDHGAADWYSKQAAEIRSQLDLFWDQQAGYIRTSRDFVDSHGKKTELDVGTILGCLHAGAQTPAELKPGSDKMNRTFHAILNSMMNIYPLNSRYYNLYAKAIGRYPEDVYDGVGVSIGNPWFITTLAMAEYLYRADSASSNSSFPARLVGDQFVEIVRHSVKTNGSMHEQFDRVTGLGLGARDLTWSHISFLSMERARKGLPDF